MKITTILAFGLFIFSSAASALTCQGNLNQPWGMSYYGGGGYGVNIKNLNIDINRAIAKAESIKFSYNDAIPSDQKNVIFDVQACSNAHCYQLHARNGKFEMLISLDNQVEDNFSFTDPQYDAFFGSLNCY